MKNRHSHITADEIIDLLKSQGTPVAKSTVYRFLAQLEESGEVRKYVIAEGSPSCYQFVGDAGSCREHYHLMCMGCGDIVHFDSEALHQAFVAVNADQGFAIDGVRTVFYGTCQSCLAKEVL